MNNELHQKVLTWLKTAGDSLLTALESDLEVEEKTSASDLVTRMDKEVEAYFFREIKAAYPNHRVIGEEGMTEEVKSTQGTLWIIDPIDGTLNYVKQHRRFAILLGLYHDGQPIAGYIYDVAQGEIYHAWVGQGVYINGQALTTLPINSLSEALIVGNLASFMTNWSNSQAVFEKALGLRYYGCSAYGIIAVIRGEAGLYLSRELKPWDFAAGLAIMTAMGYPVSRPDGRPLNILEASPVIFAHPNVYQEALQLMN